MLSTFNNSSAVFVDDSETLGENTLVIMVLWLSCFGFLYRLHNVDRDVNFNMNTTHKMSHVIRDHSSGQTVLQAQLRT